MTLITVSQDVLRTLAQRNLPHGKKKKACGKHRALVTNLLALFINSSDNIKWLEISDLTKEGNMRSFFALHNKSKAENR